PRRIGDARAELRDLLALCARAVVDGEVVARLDEARRHSGAHVAEADERDAVLRRRCHRDRYATSETCMLLRLPPIRSRAARCGAVFSSAARMCSTVSHSETASTSSVSSDRSNSASWNPSIALRSPST